MNLEQFQAAVERVNAEIRKVIIDEVSRIAQTYRSDYEIAKAREESLTKSLAEIVSVSQTTNQAQIMLRDLESSAQTYRALYDNFLQRYMESVQQQSFPITESRIITSASPPGGRGDSMKPKGLLIAVVLLAVLGGLTWWSNKTQAEKGKTPDATTTKLLTIPDDQFQAIAKQSPDSWRDWMEITRPSSQPTK